MGIFKFESKQLTFEIAGVKVGGEIGENPTVMIGSIFYSGDKIVKNGAEGIFDEEAARDIIAKTEELSLIHI